MKQGVVRPGASNGEWQVVQRWRRYPDNWKQPFTSAPTKANPFTPYLKTYAQAASSRPISPNHSPNTSSQPTLSLTSKPSTPPPTGADRGRAAVYISPHSPTKLRFPPSLTFPEWKDRCFRCCKTGHTAALCRNRLKCGRCWKEGHPGTRCLKQGVVPGEVRPSSPKTSAQTGFEPLFDELLTGHRPHALPQLPPNRPQTVTCFIDRDETYLNELSNLGQAVVVRALDWEGDLLADMVAEFAATTELVSKEDIAVASLSSSTCLIHLPPNLAPETFLRAIPVRIWDLGLDFQPWSPYLDATKAVPEYKILLELRDVPARLWKECYISKMVTSFGLFLGSISPPNPGDLAAWSVVVATDTLDRIPHTVEVVIGGIRSKICVLPVKWSRAPIYSDSDLPKQLPVFSRPEVPSPSSPPLSPGSEEGQLPSSDEELITIPRWMVVDMCKGRALESLPNDIQTYLAKRPAGEPPESGGRSQDVQPLHLPLVALATENLGSNNPILASPARTLSGSNTEADSPSRAPGSHVTILKRKQPDVASLCMAGPNPENLIGDTPSTPGPQPQMIQAPLVNDGNSSLASSLLRLGQTDEPSETAGNSLKNLLQTTCPQRLKEAKNIGPIYGPSANTRRKTRPKVVEEGGPSSMRDEGDQEGTHLKLGLEGFYEVQISNSFCKELAAGWGLLPEVVRREVERDNIERSAAATQVLVGEHPQTNEADQEDGEELSERERM